MLLLPEPLTLTLPRADPPPTRSGLPMLGALAPLVMAIVLWAVTQSIVSLLVGLLSPILALAALLDRRLAARRHRRADHERLRVELERLAERVGRHGDEERHRLTRASAGTTAGRRALRIGTGSMPSGIAWNAESGAPLPADLAARADGLAAGSARMSCPVVLEIDDGIRVVGSGVVIAAVRRALALQVAQILPPEDWMLTAWPDEEAAWIDLLPHRRRRPDGAGRDAVDYVFREVRPAGEARTVRIGAAPDSGGSIPVLEIDPAGRASLDLDGEHVDAAGLRLETRTRAQAADTARRLARASGGEATRSALPSYLAFADLDQEDDGALAAAVGIDAAGDTVALDLDRDGPHAIVGGTTGSGKSELLVTWVLALAARSGPDRLAVLLVDFKGGAAFAPLEALPQVVGVLSDLDQRAARRAVTSLRTELLRRERLLADSRVRSVSELAPDALPRLLVVIDEFAALVAEQPDLSAVIADLAARGRSLGIHLILCTQRPAGVVKESVLANATLRLSLRVNSRADSSAVVGDDSAATLPVDARGRAVLACDGATRPVQIALAGPADVRRVAERWRSGRRAAPFWTPGLPARVGYDELPPAGAQELRFGLVDLPHEQRIGAAVYRPAVDGHLLVVGGRGAGTSTALAAIAADARQAVQVPDDPAGAWSVLTAVIAGLEDRPVEQLIVLVDDVDRLLEAAGDDHRADLVVLLARVAREIARDGGALVLGAARPLTGAATLTAQLDARLLLAMPTREDHVMAGGESRDWSRDRRAGSAVWHGHEVQIAVAEPTAAPAVVCPSLDLGGDVVSIASARPAAIAAALLRRGVAVHAVDRAEEARPGSVVLGDPDDWLAEFGAIERARRGRLLVHALAAADLRALTRIRRALPPLDPRAEEAWLVEAREVSRVRVPW
ncbi:FtsK/SpoIIIE domain-containing protein [Schumannella sp. 10F1B-5-1]|uniref:FtsK/SpoIIIE domain-containing protein n=1 Tax=Schumannella sp. 10F1B-5-1 TaxID=2590780 RepID=UPI001130813F|nr:FtsK/SpoIIIE domain-containing protein [Schumannella sp. 10F1B-5-1]TPW70704.1 hypothetical protein FJ658_11260 [Schumannella sp. 10F1B-5-1]